MTAVLVKLGTINGIAPGKSVIYHWNNATPANAVWYIQAIPRDDSFKGVPLAEESVAAEVTRVWRKLIRSPGPAEFPESGDLEHEVWYEIKNVGSKDVNVDVFASIVKQKGPAALVRQFGGNIHAESDGTNSKVVTWSPPDGKPRNVLAEIALNHVHDYGQAAITKMVSTEAGTETEPTALRFRKGVTLVEFTLLVSESGASARWMVHEFSPGESDNQAQFNF
jgi:hypothetical protein